MMKKCCVYTLSVFAIPLATFAAPTKEEIIEAHGADHLYEVEEIKFTFNVGPAGSGTSRFWKWNPNDNTVTYQEPGEEPVSYDRDDLDGASENIMAVDKKFINDSFWFIWPVHLMWSEQDIYEIQGTMKAPISGKEVPCVSLVYPSEEGGYTPGDRYDLYLGDDNLPIEWTFHRGGQEEPNLANTWEDYVDVGPFTVATNHYNADKSFHLYFTDIGVKLNEGGDWIEPLR